VGVSLALDEGTLESIARRRAAGDSLVEALDGAVRATTLENGATVIHPLEKADRESIAAGLRLLAELTVGVGQSFAVLGGFEAEPADFVDDHDYIGRLIVRLNVRQLIVVGREGRHIHAAAGLEGSWDGESVIVATPGEAYDLLRGQLRDKDVVLVMGATDVGLYRLTEQLVGVAE
jgi:UDP-N-acetylmuramoyl-tripeptide--D-alanyl-D-alanine ligase